MEVRHNLKIWPVWFAAISSGKLTHNVRKNDRDFRIGDLIMLEEFRPGTGEYTGNTIKKRISHIAYGGALDPMGDGIQEGYCVLSLVDE